MMVFIGFPFVEVLQTVVFAARLTLRKLVAGTGFEPARTLWVPRAYETRELPGYSTPQ